MTEGNLLVLTMMYWPSLSADIGLFASRKPIRVLRQLHKKRQTLSFLYENYLLASRRQGTESIETNIAGLPAWSWWASTSPAAGFRASSGLERIMCFWALLSVTSCRSSLYDRCVLFSVVFREATSKFPASGWLKYDLNITYSLSAQVYHNPLESVMT